MPDGIWAKNWYVRVGKWGLDWLAYGKRDHKGMWLDLRNNVSLGNAHPLSFGPSPKKWRRWNKPPEKTNYLASHSIIKKSASFMGKPTIQISPRISVAVIEGDS